MKELYKSEYYSDLNYFLQQGWTEEEINTYFPLLESMNEKQLFQLLIACGISMYDSPETIDREQAIHVLVNQKDTPKSVLLESLKNVT